MLPLARIPYLVVDQTDETTANLLLTHLDGPLHVTVVDTGAQEQGTFRVAVYSESCRRVRTFMEWRNHYDATHFAPLPILQQQAFFERLRELHMADTLWNTLVPLFSQLPVLQALGVHFFAYGGLAPLTCALHCPALSRVSLHADEIGGTIIDAGELRNFTLRTLIGVHVPLLALDDGVVLADKNDILCDVYSELTVVNGL